LYFDGALSYLVSQRQAEFGIRMALGAPQHSILKLVTRGVVIVLAAGTAVGGCLSYAMLSGLRKMLFNVSPRE
jgi:ABC-type antimicrobial peptide transport system permease subunit